MSSAWSLFDSESDDDKGFTIPVMPDSDDEVEPQPKSQVKVATVVPTTAAVERPWSRYIPSFDLSPSEQEKLFTTQQELIASYHSDPYSHQDMKNGGTHVDGFTTPPLYQSPLITVDVNMPHRGGGRGIVATDDISPGTLLMAEYTRYPFLSKKECMKRDTRVEIEFIQELIFEMPVEYAKNLLEDLKPLHPQSLDQVSPSHLQFLHTVYEEAIQSLLDNVDQQRKDDIGLTMDVVLRVICLIHFNAFPSGISLHIAMVNHSCAPNAVKIALPKKETSNVAGPHLPWEPEYARSISEIRAAQFIKKGEEVMIGYIAPDVSDFSRPFRQGYLMRQFQFACTCTLCEQERSTVPTPTVATGADAEENTTPSTLSYIDRLVTYYYNVPTDVQMFDDEGNFRTEESGGTATVAEATGITCPAGMSTAAFIIQEAVALLTSGQTDEDTVSVLMNHTLTPYEQEQIHRLLAGSVKSILPHLHTQSVESLITLTATCAKLPWFSVLPLAKDTDVVEAGVRVGNAMREEHMRHMKIFRDGTDNAETQHADATATSMVDQVRSIANIYHEQRSRIVSSLSASLNALGLLSSLHQLNDFITKFGVHPSVKYADHLIEVSQALQGLLATPYVANKVLLTQPFVSWIGPSARDGGLFEREAFKIYSRICDLYNQCPVDSVIAV